MRRLRHFVVLVPGIGGSILSRPELPAGKARYALTATGLSRALIQPGQLDLDRFPDLVPVDLVDDFTALAPLLTLPGYQSLDLHLSLAFNPVVIDTYQPPRPIREDADVLRFPYDFRRSVADAALRLDDAIQEALRSRRPTAVDRPLILIAHSMGGLVARYWLAVLGGWRYCHALLALGVPHRGAPKALAWLVNGVGVGPIRHQRATEVIRGWPSAYELLPQYPAVWDPGAKAGSGAAVEFTKLPSALVRGHPDLASYASRFAAAAAAGRLIHEQITNDWAKIDVEQAPQVISYMGRGHATPNLAVLQGDRLRIRKRDPHWRGNVGWRGDGTVPMLSAIPHEQSDRQDLWRVMADRHGPLGSIPRDTAKS
jgi:hypothetical protein